MKTPGGKAGRFWFASPGGRNYLIGQSGERRMSR